MNTLEIGKKLVELCREGKNEEAVNTLFSADIVSVEAGGPPGQDPTTKGIAGVRGKGIWWSENHDRPRRQSRRPLATWRPIHRPLHLRRHLQARKQTLHHGRGRVVHRGEWQSCERGVFLQYGVDSFKLLIACQQLPQVTVGKWRFRVCGFFCCP